MDADRSWHARFDRGSAVVLTAVTFGFTLRFWYESFSPQPPLSFNFTAVYCWLIGTLLAAVMTGSMSRRLDFLPRSHRLILLAINAACFLSLTGPILSFAAVDFFTTP